MKKEKIVKLNKYLDDLKNKKSYTTPGKHVNRAASYNSFLDREIVLVSKKLKELQE